MRLRVRPAPRWVGADLGPISPNQIEAKKLSETARRRIAATSALQSPCVCVSSTHMLRLKQLKPFRCQQGNYWHRSRPENVPLIAAHSCSQAYWKIQVPALPLWPPAHTHTQIPPLSLVYLLPPSPLPPPLTLAHTHTHTRWYAVKFNQMLNYILTWVFTSWLYSPASD